MKGMPPINNWALKKGKPIDFLTSKWKANTITNDQIIPRKPNEKANHFILMDILMKNKKDINKIIEEHKSMKKPFVQ